MATRCPKCAAPSVLAADAGDKGRLVRCARCGTAWLARHYTGGVLGPQALTPPPPVVRRQPLVIEGELAPLRGSYRAAGTQPALPPPRQPPAPLGRPAERRSGVVRAAAALSLLALLAGGGLLAMQATGDDGDLALRTVSSKTISLRGTEAIFVEGEIVNRSDEKQTVPAVRISVEGADASVYSWVVEPTVLEVPAGGVVGFRSALASPGTGTGEVSLSLAERVLPGAE